VSARSLVQDSGAILGARDDRQLKLAAYGCLSERGQAGTAFLGDLGIVQRLEGSLVILVDHRLDRVPSARLDDQLLQLTDASVVESRIAELLNE
jgi:hypothetical protein